MSDTDTVSPRHTLNSCSDENPMNAGVGGCPRCTNLIIDRYNLLVPNAIRYHFIATCGNSEQLDVISEHLGQGKVLDKIVDGFIEQMPID